MYPFSAAVAALGVQDDVDAVFEGHAAGERQQGVGAHDDDLAARVLDKMPHVRLDVKEQTVVLADAPFFVYRNN